MKCTAALLLGLLFVAVAPCAAQKNTFQPRVPPIRKVLHDWESDTVFTFFDSKGKRWTAPAHTITDGASIPRACWTLIGDKTDEHYLGAALVHDAYCGIANKGKSSYHTEPWQAVHHMFLEACVAGGTPVAKAKVMYGAVWLLGPKKWAVVDEARYKKALAQASQEKGGIEMHGGAWSYSNLSTLEKRRIYNELLRSADTEATNLTVPSTVPGEVRERQFKELADFIQTKNPTVSQLDSVLRRAVPVLAKNQVLELPGDSHSQKPATNGLKQGKMQGKPAPRKTK